MIPWRCYNGHDFKEYIILFLIIIVGVIGERNIITPETNKGLIDLLLRILLPFMIVSSFSFPMMTV